MEVSGQLHAPAALPPRKRPWYPLDRRLGEPYSRSGHGGEEKNSQSMPRLEPPITQLVTQRYSTPNEYKYFTKCYGILYFIWLIIIYFR
jgi:hypothetical protein